MESTTMSLSVGVVVVHTRPLAAAAGGLLGRPPGGGGGGGGPGQSGQRKCRLVS